MTALVGQFGPSARWFRARPVDLEGQPSWLLGQMHAMWNRKFRGDTGQLVTALLGRDWSLLAHTAWPASLTSDDPDMWTYVDGVGRAYREAVSGRGLLGMMPVESPREGDEWAYLWECGGGALHVFAAAVGRWYHVATLPADVWARLTDQLVLDIEARRGWLERAA